MDSAQTVARAIAILEILGSHKTLTASQINKLLGYHRSTTYRLLGTLQQLKYLRKDEETGLYTLSPRILRLASAVMEQQDITAIARPFLEKLHEKTQETLHLAIVDNWDLVYLDKMESTRNLRVVMGSRKGSKAPLYCTGIGKILLAWMEDEDFSVYLERVDFVKFTENTLTSPVELKKELDEIRKQGYAVDREEHELGVFCVAAPVRDSFDRVAAALSVSLPSVRLNQTLLIELIAQVRNTAGDISRALAR
ncbi:MAG: IclR family transcriptional regulator [Spirochaetales bacterium]|nr:IclR family transcriptional regulator [Spirochaetales bacterium]